MKRACALLCLLGLVAAIPTSAFATNGDNMIAIGPIARAMGGVGIAYPLDAISAVFANPAAMCFGPYCPASEANFAGTVFMPDIDAQVKGQSPAGTPFQFDAESDRKTYIIPAIGLSVPLSSHKPFWRLGLSAYGVTGLGVDYRDSDLDQRGFYDLGPFGQAPLVSGEYTQLQIMKFAPAIAFQPFEKMSFGLALHLDYASLDLRNGSSNGYGLGVQAGMIYKIADNISLGLNYISPQNVEHENVADLDGDGSSDNLDLESPQQIGVGLAYQTLNNKLIVEADVKWLNWADANGYEDFDWDNQWVFAVGAQYEVMPKLFLRAGYNYGENPVEDHDNFAGPQPTSVQGKTLPTYYYETFRIVGFPAIVEHHVTAGIGYEFSNRFSANIGYVHAFENTIEEEGTDIFGQPVKIKSSLSQNSVDFGLTWRF